METELKNKNTEEEPSMTFKVGQWLKATRDYKTKTVSGNELTVQKGTRAILGADNFIHHISNGNIEPLGSKDTVEGYNSEGITDWIIYCLRLYMPLHEMLEGYNIEEESFRDEINSALMEIGF